MEKYFLEKFCEVNIGDAKSITHESVRSAKIITSQVVPQAFSDCICMENIYFSPETKIIGRESFFHCASLKDFDLPEKLESIEESAFSHCLNFTRLAFPKTLKRIDKHAFASCIHITQIDFSRAENLRFLEPNAFYACTSLETVDFSKTAVTKIPINCFSGCIDLQKVFLSDNITEIQPDAFLNCTNLKSINLPEKLTILSKDVFRNCPKLTVYCTKKQFEKFEKYLNNVNVKITDKSLDDLIKESTSTSTYSKRPSLAFSQCR